MAVTKYAGQPLPPGTIVCRESMLATGFCARPAIVVHETEHMVELQYPRDQRTRPVRGKKSLVVFVCDTVEEGERMHEASMRFVESEKEISEKLARERAERRKLALEAAMQG